MSGSRVSLDGLPNGYRRDRALSNHGDGRSFAVGQKPTFGGSGISVATGQEQTLEARLEMKEAAN
jgi:hypothetical protein